MASAAAVNPKRLWPGPVQRVRLWRSDCGNCIVQDSSRSFEFGDWRVDPAAGTIARGSDRRRLDPQAMSLLQMFAGSGGRVLSKDEIVAAVWQGRAIGDDTLAAAVSKLRATLGETRTRRYIETLPKRGYRALPQM